MCQWHILNVPFQRRLQTLVVLLVFPLQLYCLLTFLTALYLGGWLRYAALVRSVACRASLRDPLLL
jgi:hypothetical protein